MTLTIQEINNRHCEDIVLSTLFPECASPAKALLNVGKKLNSLSQILYDADMEAGCNWQLQTPWHEQCNSHLGWLGLNIELRKNKKFLNYRLLIDCAKPNVELLRYLPTLSSGYYKEPHNFPHHESEEFAPNVVAQLGANFQNRFIRNKLASLHPDY
jgi:hypothetical protein